MKILIFILHSLSSYFMSLTMTFSLLIFNEHPFKQEKKLKKEQNNKRHLSSKFLLDKIISLKDLNLINQCSLGNKQNTIYHHSNFLNMTTSLPHNIQNTRKKFWNIKIQQSILDIAQWNILGIIRFHWGLTKRVTIGVYAHLQNINEEIIQLQFRGK